MQFSLILNATHLAEPRAALKRPALRWGSRPASSASSRRLRAPAGDAAARGSARCVAFRISENCIEAQLRITSFPTVDQICVRIRETSVDRQATVGCVARSYNLGRVGGGGPTFAPTTRTTPAPAAPRARVARSRARTRVRQVRSNVGGGGHPARRTRFARAKERSGFIIASSALPPPVVWDSLPVRGGDEAAPGSRQ